MSFNDISIDLETLSTRFDAAILSIGAVAFDRDTGALGNTLYVAPELDDVIKHGHVMGSTLAWWMGQGAGAKALFSEEGKDSLAVSLQWLARFVAEHPGARVWGNGSSFDITILEHAYSEVGLPIPWKHTKVRDMRTIVDASQALGFDTKAMIFEGVAHNALDDAVHQAKVIASSWAAIMGGRHEF